MVLSGGGEGGEEGRPGSYKRQFTVTDCRSRKQKRKNKPVTMFVPKRDCPISFAVACDQQIESDGVVTSERCFHQIMVRCNSVNDSDSE